VPIRAVVVGTGSQANAMARAARRDGMDWLELPGRLTRYEIQQLYSAADVYLAPARLESFWGALTQPALSGNYLASKLLDIPTIVELDR
jgi:glycosyltransferase involved in cell wall biosynthesis